MTGIRLRDQVTSRRVRANRPLDGQRANLGGLDYAPITDVKLILGSILDRHRSPGPDGSGEHAVCAAAGAYRTSTQTYDVAATTHRHRNGMSFVLVY